MGEERIILPPPIQRRRENEILDEIPSELGVQLWLDVRHLRAWAESSEDVRARLFNRTPPAWVAERRKDARAQATALSGALTLFASVLDTPQKVDTTAVAMACAQVVDWALKHEHFQTAIEFAEAAALVDPANPAMANLAGRVTRNAKEFARSEVWFNRGIGYAREQDNKVELARGHLGYGTLCKELGRVRGARKHLNSGSRIARKHGPPSLGAEAQHDLCALLIVRGHHSEAEKRARRALNWYGKSHQRFPFFAADVALLLVLERNYTAALRLLKGVLRLVDRPGPRSVILALYTRALAGIGERDSVAHFRRRVLRLLTKHREWEAAVLWHLANAERLLERWESAEADALRGLAVALKANDRETIRLTWRTLREIRSRQPAPRRVSRKDEEFRLFFETLVGRLSEWSPRRARSRRPPWGDQWAA